MTHPRIELHLHLEGAAPPGFIRALAARKGRSLPGVFTPDGRYHWRDFGDFLAVYELASSVLDTPADYAALLTEVLAAKAEEGAAYVELFVAPQLQAQGDRGAWREHVAAMSDVAATLRAAGIDSRGIVVPIRHFGPEASRPVALMAAETAGEAGQGWIAGFGLAGAESDYRPQDFAWAFDCAREAGLGLTCHAGEWGGPQSVRDALALGVSRIGHGARAIEDPTLVRDLAERGVVLESCPGANIALGLYADWARHPIGGLADAGCRVTVSTDDPAFFGTSLDREYDRLADAFGWGEAEFNQMNRWSAEAAFCDAATRVRMIATLAPAGAADSRETP